MEILFVEDHPIVVSGCRQLFADHADVTFYDAQTIAGGRRILRERALDVVVIDLHLPDGSGLDFIREIRQRRPQTKVIVFSVAEEAPLAMQAIDYGAHGFVSKNGRPADLLVAIDAVCRGESWLSEDLLQQVALMRAVPHTRAPRLTRREKDVLKLLTTGRHQSEIAKDLNISTKSVATDCMSIRQKLNARTTAEMIAIAVKSNVGE
jgi:DNA-binding NarL/FixJ family response regulator